MKIKENQDKIQMTYISKGNALIYYDELLKNYNYDSRYLYIKVPCLKNIMENEILKEVTGINHFKNPYELGQLKWLKDNIEKRNKNGDIINGFIPKQIVSGNEHLFDQRNTAEHDKKMSKATYLGIFDTIAKTINFFSGIDIPKEIIDICEGTNENTKQKININKNSNKKTKVNNDNVWTGYYFVNTGISDDPNRNWKFNIKYNFISAGNKKIHVTQIKGLKKGDKIFAYFSEKGYVGYGIVDETAVFVTDYYINGKKMVNEKDFIDHAWKNASDKDKDEWIVKVKWIKVFNENEAKWEKGKFANQSTVCKLTDKATLEYLCKEFCIEDENKTNQ